MPWLRPCVTGLSTRRDGFDPRSVGVRFAVDKVAISHVSLPVLIFVPVSVIPPMLHSHFHINATFIRRTSGRSLGSFKQKISHSDIEGDWTESTFHVFIQILEK